MGQFQRWNIDNWNIRREKGAEGIFEEMIAEKFKFNDIYQTLDPRTSEKIKQDKFQIIYTYAYHIQTAKKPHKNKKQTYTKRKS